MRWGLWLLRLPHHYHQIQHRHISIITKTNFITQKYHSIHTYVFSDCPSQNSQNKNVSKMVEGKWKLNVSWKRLVNYNSFFLSIITLEALPIFPPLTAWKSLIQTKPQLPSGALSTWRLKGHRVGPWLHRSQISTNCTRGLPGDHHFTFSSNVLLFNVKYTKFDCPRLPLSPDYVTRLWVIASN